MVRSVYVLETIQVITLKKLFVEHNFGRSFDIDKFTAETLEGSMATKIMKVLKDYDEPLVVKVESWKNTEAGVSTRFIQAKISRFKGVN